MIQACKDVVIAFLVGSLVYIIVLIITNDSGYSKTTWLVATNFLILERRILRLENRLRTMERLFGWNLDKGKK